MTINLGITSFLLLILGVFSSSLGFPGGLVSMVTFGALSGNTTTLLIVILLSFSVAVVGDLIAYELARKYSSRLKNKLLTLSFFKENEKKAKGLLDKFGFYIVFFTRFALINLCAVISYISGLEKTKRRKFIFAVIAGEAIYATLYPILGFIFGIVFTDVINSFNDAVLALIIILIIVYMIVFIIKRFRKKSLKKKSNSSIKKKRR